MLKSVLKRALGLGTAVVEGARTEGESIIVSAGPRRAALRRPARGRRCDGYDALPARRWRAPDAGSARRYVEYAPRRVGCPEHGVRAGAVPWARAAPSRFTSAFEDTVARLALHMLMCNKKWSEWDLGQNLGPSLVQEGVRCTPRRSARGSSGSSIAAA